MSAPNPEKQQEQHIDEISSAGTLITQFNVDLRTGYVKARRVRQSVPIWHRLFEIFLPAGYPSSVTPDYTSYQIYDSLQAFSSSIAGLLASRAILEGFGVGKADASATKALILTIAQETVGRISTILFAWRLGTVIEPEAKRYRLLADFFNDAAIIFDAITPYFMLDQTKQTLILCTSGALRALCGVAAGSAKAALSVHFARSGNIGDLNAKDSSQETVIGLLGMLAGTYAVKLCTSPTTTWFALAILISIHLFTNYLAVRSVVMTTMSRQRASLIFTSYLDSGRVLSPQEVATHEQVFGPGSVIRNVDGRKLGRGRIGVSVSRFMLLRAGHVDTRGGYRICKHQAYAAVPQYWVCLMKDVDTLTELKAWFHIVYLTWRHSALKPKPVSEFDGIWDNLVEDLKKAGWELNRHSLVLDSEYRMVVR